MGLGGAVCPGEPMCFSSSISSTSGGGWVPARRRAVPRAKVDGRVCSRWPPDVKFEGGRSVSRITGTEPGAGGAVQFSVRSRGRSAKTPQSSQRVYPPAPPCRPKAMGWRSAARTRPDRLIERTNVPQSGHRASTADTAKLATAPSFPGGHHPVGDLGRLNSMDVVDGEKVQGGVRLLTWFDPDTYSLTAPGALTVQSRHRSASTAFQLGSSEALMVIISQTTNDAGCQRGVDTLSEALIVSSSHLTRGRAAR